MKCQNVLDELAMYGGYSKSHFTRVGSYLRDADIVPTKADLTHQDVTAIFTASVASYKPGNAVKVVSSYHKCTNEKGKSFFDALDEIFSKPEVAEQVKTLIICQTIPEATLVWHDGTKEVFKFKGAGVKRPLISVDTTVNGAVIHQLSFRFNAKPEPNGGVLMGDAVDEMVKQLKNRIKKDK